MSNTGEFYDHTTYPVTRSTGTSAGLRQELDLVEAGFNKLPPLSGNALRLVKVGSGGTDMTVSSVYEDTSNRLMIGTTAILGDEKVRLVGNLQLDNANYVKSRLAAGTVTRIVGINASDLLYFGTIDAAHSGTLFVNGGVLQANFTDVGVFTLRQATSILGYGTGAGGAVTQLTSKSTGVTLDRPSGQITMNNAALAANTAVSLTLTNSVIGVTDVVSVCIDTGATAGAYTVTADSVAAGSCRISLRNHTAGSLSEGVVLNFVVLRAATA